MKRMPLIALALGFVALSAAVGAGAGGYAYRVAMDRLAEQGRADLGFATDRLTTRLMRYRELAVVLTSQPQLQGLIFDPSDPRDRAEAGELVRRMADKTGALAIDLVAASGEVLASSGPVAGAYDPARQPVARALNGALGTAHGINAGPNAGPARVFSFAAPVYGTDGPAIGAIVVAMDVRGIEDNWPGNAPAVYFADESGTVFVSNRSELLLSKVGAGGRIAGYEPSIGPGPVWLLEGARYLPHRALHLSRRAPSIGLTAHVLLDAGPTLRGAALAAGATVALLLVFGAAMLVAILQRAALRERLALEAAANARLEAGVRDRTRALANANTELRREIGERKDAEAALQRAQDELVQAGKLSALGEMSAGISHELNQPLMAIRSFAENGAAYLERGQPDKARENLGRIGDLARRAGRIIQNLRAFARQEKGRVSDVDLVSVVNEALEMSAERIARHGVTVTWAPPAHPALVRGGAVRLQQVVGNLVTNAVDAMAEMPQGARRRLEIALAGEGSPLRLTVADTGPGLREPDRVFDPFYSTKAVGAAEGMGLGLSISYGLAQSFGGTLRAANRTANRAGVGAVFTLELPRGGVQEAAE